MASSARRLRVSALAESDIEDVLEWSNNEFGELARARYAMLIAGALRAIAEDSDRVGVNERPDLGKGVLTYHLHFSRKLVPGARSRVQAPRHLFVFRLAKDGAIEVARLLHDSMELERHLPRDSG
jgi:toxin ParE1/3/4